MSNQPNKDRCPHRGHRARMKKRFSKSLGKDFSDHELLEMLLYYVIPRSDTNELAHRLLNEFGTLREVINADPARVEAVVGAGRATSTFLSLLFTIKKRTDTQKYTSSKFLADSATKVGNYFVDYFRDTKTEEFCAMLLDNSLRLIKFLPLSSGSANGAATDVPALAKQALRCNATHVILAHNHPSGVAVPSSHDRELTLEAEKALLSVGINLLEHIIVNDTGFKPTMYVRALGNKSSETSSLQRKFYNGI